MGRKILRMVFLVYLVACRKPEKPLPMVSGTLPAGSSTVGTFSVTTGTVSPVLEAPRTVPEGLSRAPEIPTRASAPRSVTAPAPVGKGRVVNIVPDPEYRECNVFFDVDREIHVGDKVLIYRRADGKLGNVRRISSFTNLPSYAKVTCTGQCYFPATVLEQNIDGWLITSYGVRSVVQIDKDSKPQNFQDYNVLWFDYHNIHYEKDIDPKAINQSVSFRVPCWKDRVDIVPDFAIRSKRCVSNGREVPCS